MHALFLNFVMLLLCRHAEQLALHNAQATNSNAMVRGVVIGKVGEFNGPTLFCNFEVFLRFLRFF